MKWKGVLLASAAGLMLSLAAAQPAQADRNDRGYGRDDRYGRDRDKCFDKVRKEQDKLERDIRKHGWNSRQARNRREKIQRTRYQCADRYGWGRYGRDDGWWGRDRRDRDRDWRDDDRNRRDRDRNRRPDWWRRR